MIISVRTNLREFSRQVDNFQRRQIPFAAARALTDMANAAKARVTADLPSTFDRPTPFTNRAVKIVPATKGNLRAVVTVQPIQAEYLQLEETGGTRTAAMNTRNKARALLEPRGLRLNAYGNIPNGAMARLRKGYEAVKLQRKANVEARRAAPKGEKRAAARGVYSGYVYIKGGSKQAHGNPGGMFKLSRFKLFRLTGFAKDAQYKPRFHFRGTVVGVATRGFNGAMAKRLAEAMKTARP
jgi:hypothetical protein